MKKTLLLWLAIAAPALAQAPLPPTPPPPTSRIEVAGRPEDALRLLRRADIAATVVAGPAFVRPDTAINVAERPELLVLTPVVGPVDLSPPAKTLHTWSVARDGVPLLPTSYYAAADDTVVLAKGPAGTRYTLVLNSLFEFEATGQATVNGQPTTVILSTDLEKAEASATYVVGSVPPPTPAPPPAPAPAPPAPPVDPTPTADGLGQQAATAAILAQTKTWAPDVLAWRQGTLAQVFRDQAARAASYAELQAMVAGTGAALKDKCGASYPAWQKAVLGPVQANLKALVDDGKIATPADLATAYLAIAAALGSN